MRMVNLRNFPVTSSAYRLLNRSTASSSSNNAISRVKSSVTTSSPKALNLLRQSLQKSLNQDLDAVMQKYLEDFFRPAVENIKKNNGETSVSEYHLQAVCRQFLDEAKKMYFLGHNGHNHTGQGTREDDKNHQSLKHDQGRRRSSSPSSLTVNHLADVSDTESNPGQEGKGSRKRGRFTNNSNFMSDNESDDRDLDRKISKRRKNNKTPTTGLEGRTSSMSKSRNSGDGVDRSGYRWDPERLTTSTKFVLGSKANKSLGFGLTRGRLYTKHPELFRYIGDMEDRTWLSERGLMPPAGGRAYLIIKEDIEQLIESDEYVNAPGVNADDMGQGFVVPQFMIDKMKSIMSNMRSKSGLSDNKDKQQSSPASFGTHSPEAPASVPSRPASSVKMNDETENALDDEVVNHQEDLSENLPLPVQAQSIDFASDTFVL